MLEEIVFQPAVLRPWQSVDCSLLRFWGVFAWLLQGALERYRWVKWKVVLCVAPVRRITVRLW